jgi:hypothetical protein
MHFMHPHNPALKSPTGYSSIHRKYAQNPFFSAHTKTGKKATLTAKENLSKIFLHPSWECDGQTQLSSARIYWEWVSREGQNY